MEWERENFDNVLFQMEIENWNWIANYFKLELIIYAAKSSRSFMNLDAFFISQVKNDKNDEDCEIFNNFYTLLKVISTENSER